MRLADALSTRGVGGESAAVSGCGILLDSIELGTDSDAGVDIRDEVIGGTGEVALDRAPVRGFACGGLTVFIALLHARPGGSLTRAGGRLSRRAKAIAAGVGAGADAGTNAGTGAEADTGASAGARAERAPALAGCPQCYLRSRFGGKSFSQQNERFTKLAPVGVQKKGRHHERRSEKPADPAAHEVRRRPPYQRCG